VATGPAYEGSLRSRPLVITQSEDLFELIDKDEQPMVLGLIVQSKLCSKVWQDAAHSVWSHRVLWCRSSQGT
jgi:hypothetical protein